MSDNVLRVLIVEDNPMDAELLELELQRSGFRAESQRVQTAATMQAALESAEWDLILCDYNTAHFTGLQAIHALKASAKDIPFILLFGSADEDIAIHATRVGAHDFFVKGKLTLLGSAIRRELEERDLRFATRGRHHETLDALWQSEERFRLIVNAVKGYAIFMLDPEGRIVTWNQGAEQMTGFSAADVLGRSISVLRSQETEAGDLKELLQQVRRDGSAEWDDAGIRKDGLRYLHHVYCTTMLSQSGELIGYVSVTRDVTEQRSLEAQLLQAQKLESLGQLACGVAHDFNNMLMVIFTRCDLLLRQLESEKLRRFVSDIHTAAMKNRDLTQQLLGAARRQTLEPSVMNLNDVITSAMRLLAPTLGEQIDIQTSLDPQLWSVYADPGKLHQVLVNLAINARDAMPQGGMLSIESCNVQIDSIYARQHIGMKQGEYVSLIVSDTGSGISPEIRDRIYDPFFTTKGPDKGTGLGLAVVRGVVEQSGGQIWMYSEEGRGTAFKVFLPRHATKAPLALSIDDEIPERGHETILLVEDEALLRTVAHGALEEQGYHVLEARVPAEALTISEHFTDQIELLLTDVVMPGFTGFELARTLITHRPGLRVIFMSGYSSQAAQSLGVWPSVVRHLEKPVMTTALLRAIRSALDEGSHEV